MTVVGKILVFLNLVFSLVVGVFAIMTHAAGTDFKKANDAYAQRYQMLEASQKAYKEDNDRLRGRETALAKALLAQGVTFSNVTDAGDVGKAAADLLDLRNKQNLKLEQANKTLTTERDQARATALKAETAAEAAKVDIERRGNEARKLREIWEQTAKQNTQLVSDMNGLRDRAVVAELKASSLDERVRQLSELVSDQLKELTDLRTNLVAVNNGGGGTAGLGRMPVGVTPDVARPSTFVPSKSRLPLEKVEGSVTRVDGNLIGISIGSDQGLLRDHTMHVFRTAGQGKYIGEVRIVHVTAQSAVGQWTGKPKVSALVGDKVSSRILGD